LAERRLLGWRLNWVVLGVEIFFRVSLKIHEC
jgi:hypothetical protein